MILLLSNRGDRTTKQVEERLTDLGKRYLTLHGEDWPAYRVVARPSDGVLSVHDTHDTYDLTDVEVVWNRRPIPRPEELAEEWGLDPKASEFEFMVREWYGWFKGLRLASPVWVNDPAANRRAESKVEQLSMAEAVGFRVPETVVSNDPETIRQSLEKWGGRGIAKALTTGAVGRAPIEAFIFTTSITVGDLQEDEEIQACPFIVQEELRPKADFRVTVFGDQAITCEIQPQPGEHPPVDWREDQDSHVLREGALPNSVSKKCLALVSSLQLNFAAIDLIKYESEFYFVEVNPNGQWGWLDPHLETDLPLEFARFLSSFTGD